MKLTVNGEGAPEGVLEAEINSLLARFRQLPAEQLEQYGFNTPEAMQEKAIEWGRENVVERMLLRQEALKDETPVPDQLLEQAVAQAYEQFGGKEKFDEAGLSEDDVRKDAEGEAKIAALIAKLTEHVKPPKQKEIADYYRKHRDQFRVPESVNATHILKQVDEENSAEDARKAIDEVKAAIDGGADFSETATEHCHGPSELGWFPRGRMVPRFDEVVFALEPGKVSDVFRTQFGFHIVKVLERRDETLAPLSEVRDHIAQQLRGDAQNQILEPFIDKLREKATVEFDPSES